MNPPPANLFHRRATAAQRLCLWLAGLQLLLAAGAGAQSVPQERPRIRPASALTGWADWEKGGELLKRIQVPPAPVRTAAEQLGTFRVAPGYRVELVASEPMVQNPIFFEFDPAGRIWVVEYQGYMRDLAGRGEGDPICRLVVLEDTDADGRADRSTVFLDQLVMPRSFAFVQGGVLLQEPPKLWFCEDTDGDLRCDRRTEVGTLGVAGNPQHTANGLRPGLDNWLHNADAPKRQRWRNGRLEEQETVHRGQFGVTFDETGRFYTCYENRALFGDYLPAEYLLRNRHLLALFQRGGSDRSAFGVNVNLAARAQEIYPIRVTPGVTLGALELGEDGRLRTYTIASGVCYYDGHQFPPDARGNVFVPESGGHLIGRLKLSGGITPQAARFYPPEQELLASTDERFRPVNARVGPDGALYVADLYHGIIEHVIFMVPWLTQQIEQRGLGEGNDRGRLWRIVATDQPIDRTPPRLHQAPGPVLVRTLEHPNGWHRLTAQRLLVEQAEPGSAPLLRSLARGANALAALHALWTLDGLGELESATRRQALTHADERVRAAAVRLSEGDRSAAALDALLPLVTDPSPAVRLQLALSLGTFADPRALAALGELLRRDAHPLLRTAAATGLGGREHEFLQAQPADATDRGLIHLLAACVLQAGQREPVEWLLTVLERPTWQRPVLEALAATRLPQPLALTREPAVLAGLLRQGEPAMRDLAQRAARQFTWPGRTAPSVLNLAASPLTAAERERAQRGEGVYTLACAPCHQPHGGGSAGVAPPLAGSDWVAGPPERLVRVVLHGLYGPIEVNGQSWNLSMPGLGGAGLLDDEQLAGVLTFIRQAWGNTAAPVSPDLVAQVRRETAGRGLPWRAEELLQVAGTTAAPPPIQPAANGELTLPASRARVFAQRLAYRPSLDILGPWVVKEDLAEWTVKVPSAGTYEVRLLLAADEVSAGNQFVVETEGDRLTGTVQSSGGFDRFHEFAAGRLTLRAGENRVLLRPHGNLKRELADVRALRLVPVAK